MWSVSWSYTSTGCINRSIPTCKTLRRSNQVLRPALTSGTPEDHLQTFVSCVRCVRKLVFELLSCSLYSFTNTLLKITTFAIERIVQTFTDLHYGFICLTANGVVWAHYILQQCRKCADYIFLSVRYFARNRFQNTTCWLTTFERV